MKCQQCVEMGQKSQVYLGISSSTLMGWTPYFDEDGQYHSHDPNWTTTGYRCSEGHNWQKSSQKPCLNCLYGREEKKDDKKQQG